MLRSKYLMQIVMLLLLIYFCDLRNAFAHVGHDHSYYNTPLTIKPSTYIHFKSILSVYHEIYVNLTEGQPSSVQVLAQVLLDNAGRGIQTESKGAGRHMMAHILQGAQRLRKAEGLHEMQEAFALISDAILPFFKSWSNQLKRNKIKLYKCNEHGHYWLQSQDISPACPYTLDKSLNCSDIEEVINKK